MKTTAKKNYITPIIETYKIELQQMIADSCFTPSNTTTTGTVTNDAYDGTFSSRGGSSWDDDE